MSVETEQMLWDRYLRALVAWQAKRDEATENAVVDAYAGWAIVFVGDAVTAHELTEKLRRDMQALRRAA
jgi:hypothetical protein